MIKYDKLVRDKIPEIIKNANQIPIVHTASDEEYANKLKEKLKEEINEFLESNTEEELADVLEVIYSICDLKGIDKEELEKLREKKSEERGSFDNRVILDEVN